MSTTEAPKRNRRELTPGERKVRNWIMKNKGVLSRTAKEFGLSVPFVERIAYSREARSNGLRVEHRLKELGCPLQIHLR